ncbi:MAG: hypothetical protein ACK5QX_08010, partial [bacterium]
HPAKPKAVFLQTSKSNVKIFGCNMSVKMSCERKVGEGFFVLLFPPRSVEVGGLRSVEPHSAAYE